MRRRQKAWVFVSHSTQDISAVRRIRNEVELQGGEPLLFFLKCVSDSDELDDLLKREIEARRYFLLCESNAALSSKWVQDEVSHVRSLKGKKLETAKLGDDWPDQVSAIQRLLREATIFPCYAAADRLIVDPLLNALSSQEFSVFDAFDRDGSLSQLSEEINLAIDSSGYFLHFISSESLSSDRCKREAGYFRDRHGNASTYIQVILEPYLSLDFVPEARKRVAIDFSQRNIEAFTEQLEGILYG